MKDITKRYPADGFTIVWRPSLCQHSTICWKQATGLPAVFNPFRKPWIEPGAAPGEAIRAQIEKCPSGALSWISGHQEGEGQ